MIKYSTNAWPNYGIFIDILIIADRSLNLHVSFSKTLFAQCVLEGFKESLSMTYESWSLK